MLSFYCADVGKRPAFQRICVFAYSNNPLKWNGKVLHSIIQPVNFTVINYYIDLQKQKLILVAFRLILFNQKFL